MDHQPAPFASRREENRPGALPSAALADLVANLTPRTVPRLVDEDGLRRGVADELRRRALATVAQLERAAELVRTQGGLFLTRLVEAGVRPSDVVRAAAAVANVPPAPPAPLAKPDGQLAGRISFDACREHLCAPFGVKDGQLLLAFADPRGVQAAVGHLPPFVPHLAPEAVIRAAVTSLYGTNRESRAPPTGEPLPARLAGYEIERLLGSGDAASVFLAREASGRPVALKVLPLRLAAEPAQVARFERELEATRGLRDANVVEVLGAGEEAGRPWLACEYVDGGSVARLLTATRRLSAPVVLELAAQLYAGLAYAHGRGVVHGDLKPGNLLVTTTGFLKIANFGAGGNAGPTSVPPEATPYLSPEQASGHAADVRSDLYAAGVILYELLSGQNPALGDTPAATLANVLKGPTPLAEVEPTTPPALEALVDRLLEREPSARFASAADVALALAPELEQSRARFPNVLTSAVRDPARTHAEVSKRLAEAYTSRAEGLLKLAGTRRLEAALWLNRATLLDPANEPARRLFARVCEVERLHFGPSANPRIHELTAAAEAHPDDARALRELAELHRVEGNVVSSAACLRRYLRLRPQDGDAAGQLLTLTGEKDAVRAITGKIPPVRPASLRVVARTTPAGVQPVKPPARAPTTRATPPSLGALAAPPKVSPARRLVRDHRAMLLLVAAFVGAGLATVAVTRRLHASARARSQPTADLGAAPSVDPEEEAAASEADAQLLAAELDAHAQDAAARLELATRALRRGDYSEAIAQSAALLDRYPKRREAEEAAFVRGKALAAAGRSSEALAALGELTRVYPASPRAAEALLLAAEAAEKLGDAEGALARLDRVVEGSPDSPFALAAQLRRGELGAERRRPGADADLRAVVARTGPGNPMHERAAVALAKLLSAQRAL